VTESVCPVCGASAAGIEFVCTDFYVSGESFPVMICSGCGFRMTGSSPDPEAIGKYYQSEEYVSHSNTRQGVVNRMYHAVRHYMMGIKYRMVISDSGLATGHILDIGAGTGHFLKIMQDKNWEITGIEVSEKAREFASTHFGITLFPGNQRRLLPTANFDVITLWHVLEHLHNPGTYWEDFVKMIKPGGTLIIALPNPVSFDAGFYKQYWAAWDVPRHLWHFNTEHIVRQAENHGFHLRRIRRLPFDAFYVSILSEKYRRSTFPVLRGMVMGSASWLISLFRKRKCSSLVYIFKK
jgi:2-polyprenyl-3-methyl-5-hydroxy-6-metoxy-1,4-benzoquinol methylase